MWQKFSKEVLKCATDFLRHVKYPPWCLGLQSLGLHRVFLNIETVEICCLMTSGGKCEGSGHC